MKGGAGGGEEGSPVRGGVRPDDDDDDDGGREGEMEKDAKRNVKKERMQEGKKISGEEQVVRRMQC